MKNFKLLLATAVLFAVGSAFASTNTKAVTGEYYRDASGFHLKGPDGECVDNGPSCSYTIINPSGSLTDPNNFTPVNDPGVWDE